MARSANGRSSGAQVDVIVARGTLVVGYQGEPTRAKNANGDEYIASMGEPIEKGPGERVTLDRDEAERLLAEGIVRLPAVDGDLPAPAGAANGPNVGFEQGPRTIVNP